MNQKNFNKNITGTPVKDVPENTMQQNRDRFLSCRFDVMDDDNIYSVSFNGKLPENEAKKLITEMRNCLYENMADYIQTYLKQHNLIYSDFIFSKMPLEHNKIMKLTEYLLHSNTCGIFDNYFGNANIFYAIADHQKLIAENCCQGCYFAVKRTFSESENLYKHNIIGQTFNCNEINGDENGYITIRENKDGDSLYNIASSSGKPILPTFGCVDMLGILLNIDNIQTIEQAEKIAIR